MHLRTPSILAVLVLIAVSRSGAGQERPSQELPGQDGIVWGEVRNGLQMGISPPVHLSDTLEFAGFKSTTKSDGVLNFSIHLRNTGKTTVRLLPTLWSCLALGDSGAIPVSSIQLTPVDGNDSLVAKYQGWNHLKLLDSRRPEGESWQKTLCDSTSVENDIRLIHEEAVDRQVEIAPGDSIWPEWIELDVTKNGSTSWKITKPSEPMPVGTYRVSATLVIDQPASEWKGVLTSGMLEIAIPATRTDKNAN